jgi:hypothetical protein
VEWLDAEGPNLKCANTIRGQHRGKADAGSMNHTFAHERSTRIPKLSESTVLHNVRDTEITNTYRAQNLAQYGSERRLWPLPLPFLPRPLPPVP